MTKSIILGAVVFLSANLSAQISNTEIISMKKAGISDEIIKTKVATENSKFDVSPNAILELKNNEISDEVISLMMQKNAALKAYSDRTGTDVTNEETFYITSIKENGESLLINNNFSLSKGDELQIFLPALGNKEFSFITQNNKIIGKNSRCSRNNSNRYWCEFWKFENTSRGK